MSKVRSRGEHIRRFILGHVEKHPTDLGMLTAKHFGITRQAVSKHLNKLVDEQALVEKGQTRNKAYSLIPIVEWKKAYKVNSALTEDIVWSRDIRPLLDPMPDNVRDIWAFGFTEMLNNAIDHSGGDEAVIYVWKTAANTEILIRDNGVGIFKKIQMAFDLLDERHAILELSKGKLTTDPKNHSGQGIFFTSRMFDEYTIFSGGVHFSHKFGHLEDWIREIDREIVGKGTTILMKLHNHTTRTSKKIFDQFSSGEDYGFNKTVVPLELARYGNDQLVSRSQAKRLLARVELFKVVMFDFKNIEYIGQAFADEIFRVFANNHSDVNLLYINANSEVEKMIKRAKFANESQ